MYIFPCLTFEHVENSLKPVNQNFSWNACHNSIRGTLVDISSLTPEQMWTKYYKANKQITSYKTGATSVSARSRISVGMSSHVPDK